jgi:hypothetical protein
MKATNQIITSRLGRLMLHAICMVRSPRHLAWHCQGILREFHLRLHSTGHHWLARQGRTACSVVMALTLLTVPVVCKSQSTSTTNLLPNSAPDFSLVQGQPAGTNASIGGTTFTKRIHETGVETNAGRVAPLQRKAASNSQTSAPPAPTGLRIVAVGQP